MGFIRKIELFALVAFIAGCSGLRTRDEVRTQSPRPVAPGTPLTPSQPGTVQQEDDLEASPAPEDETPFTTTPGASRIPKVGLILGPGGARVFAQIGVLQEIQKEKIPVVAVGGIEWGSVVAGLYANKGLANEAEWQMSKLKSDDLISRSLIGGKSGPVSVSLTQDFLKMAFGGVKAERSKISFACPAHNLGKNQVFLMTRGAYTQLLPFCLAYPPIFQPWQGNVAALRDVRMLADHLRSKGATTIVLINVLDQPSANRPIAGEPGSTESVLWNEISAFYSKPIRGVDHIVSIPLGARSLTAFGERRDILHKGSEKGATPVKQLARRLGL